MIFGALRIENDDVTYTPRSLLKHSVPLISLFLSALWSILFYHCCEIAILLSTLSNVSHMIFHGIEGCLDFPGKIKVSTFNAMMVGSDCMLLWNWICRWNLFGQIEIDCSLTIDSGTLEQLYWNFEIELYKNHIDRMRRCWRCQIILHHIKCWFMVEFWRLKALWIWDFVIAKLSWYKYWFIL